MTQIFISTDFIGFAQLLDRSNASKRIINELRARAAKAAVLDWQARILPTHFKGGLQNRYSGQQRRPPYSDIKRKLARGEKVYVGGVRLRDKVKKGGVVKVVRSGKTEQQARVARAVRSTPNKAVLSMSVPRYAATRPLGGKPDLPSEITATVPADVAYLRRTWLFDFMRNLKRVRGKTTRRGK